MARSFLVITAALALGLSSTSWADSRDDRYNSYNQRSSIVGLANQVEDLAEQIHKQYARNNRRPDRDEHRALTRLRELDYRADDFYNRVRSSRQDPRYTAREFQELLRTYSATEDALYRIDRRPYVDRGMERIDDLLRQMSRYYGLRTDRRSYGDRDRWDRDSRWDRDRRDRRDDGRWDRDRYDKDDDDDDDDR
jgi:hypothetical protein